MIFKATSPLYTTPWQKACSYTSGPDSKTVGEKQASMIYPIGLIIKQVGDWLTTMALASRIFFIGFDGGDICVHRTNI